MRNLIAILSIVFVAGCTLTTQAPQDDVTPTTLVIVTDEAAPETTAETSAGDTVGGPFTNGSSDTTSNTSSGSTTTNTSGGSTSNTSSGSTSNTSGGSLPVCYVRSDWPVYAVVAGDTLANIARRSNSTVTALTQANCLSNPNALNVGQVLRVPIIPAPRANFSIGQVAQVTPDGHDLRVRSQPGTSYGVMGELLSGICVTVTAGPTTVNGYTWWQIQGPRGLNGWVAEGGDGEIWLRSQYTTCTPVSNGPDPVPDPIVTFNCLDARWRVIGSSFVTLSPYQKFSNGCYQLDAGTNLTVSWPGAPPNSTQVTFYRRSDNSTRSDVIGVDNNPADGFSISYSVPGAMPPSVIYAEAVAGIVQGSLVTSDMVGFYTWEVAEACPDWVQVSNPIVQITPSNGFDGRCYQLAAGTTVTMSYPDAPPGTIEVTFYRNNPVLPKADVMGVDRDPSDGWSIQVAVSSWAASDIFARSNTGEQASETESGHAGVYVTN